MTSRSQETFAAIYDDDAEAAARYALYQSRLLSAAGSGARTESRS